MKDKTNETEVPEESKGNAAIQVECGLNKAVLHLERLCQGSKGACILFEKTWMTPNEFQAASGRETAKDWKRSIKHHDKSLKLLMIKDLFSTGPAACSCDYCTGTEPLPPQASSPSQTTSVTKVTDTQKAKENATSHQKQNANSDDKADIIQISGRKGRAAFKTRKRRRSRATLKGKVPKVKMAERDGPTCEDATQNNNETEKTKDKIRPDDSDANSDVSDNSRTLVDKANGSDKECNDNDHLDADEATDRVSPEYTLVDITCNKENGEPHRSNTDHGSGVACDAEEAATFDDRDCCETERRRSNSERSADKQNGDNVTAYTSGGDDMICEYVENGSESEKRDLDEEMERNGIKSNVLKETTSTDIVTEVVHLLEEKCPTFESETCQRHATLNSLLEPQNESDHILEDESLSLGLNTCSARLQLGHRSTTPLERVGAMQPPEFGVSLAEITKATHPQARDLTQPTELCVTQVDTALIPLSHTPVYSSSTALGSVEIASCVESKATEVEGELHEDAKNSELCGHGNYGQMNTILGNAAKDNADTKDEPRSAAAMDGIDNIEGAADRGESDSTDIHKAIDVTVGSDGNSRPDISRNENNESPSSKRDTRLLNIIHELKTYKKRLSTKTDDTRRNDETPQYAPESSKVLTTASTYTEHLYRGERAHCTLPSTIDSTSRAATTLIYGTRSPANGGPVPPTPTGSPWLHARHTTWQPASITTSAPVMCVGGTRFTTGLGLDATCKISLPLDAGDVVPRDRETKMAHCSGYIGSRTNSLVDAYNSAISDLSWRNQGHAFNNAQLLSRESAIYAPAGLWDMSARKRKAKPEHGNISVKKQRNNWITNCSDATAFLPNYGYRTTNGVTEKRVSDYSPTTGVGFVTDDHRSAKVDTARFSTVKTKVVAARHSAKSARRTPVSSWSADDVYDFVLSSPHAAHSAKEFLELRITGRVLQNLTAIQMMRILRIGEHAARAVRAAVEKLLVTSPEQAQSVRK